MTINTEAPATVNGAVPNGRMTLPPKTQRRPMLWLLGIALVAVGGLVAAWLTTVVGNTSQVVALRNDVDRGTVIEAGDLMTVEISGDPALKTVEAGEEGAMVGKYASRDLTANSLLTASAVSEEVIPKSGDALVGVALTQAQLPSTPLHAGDQVQLVSTPRAQEDLPEGAATSIDATVVRTGKAPDTNQVIVDVTVPSEDATALAAMVATGRVALVVDGAAE